MPTPEVAHIRHIVLSYRTVGHRGRIAASFFKEALQNYSAADEFEIHDLGATVSDDDDAVQAGDMRGGIAGIAVDPVELATDFFAFLEHKYISDVNDPAVEHALIRVIRRIDLLKRATAVGTESSQLKNWMILWTGCVVDLNLNSIVLKDKSGKWKLSEIEKAHILHRISKVLTSEDSGYDKGELREPLGADQTTIGKAAEEVKDHVPTTCKVCFGAEPAGEKKSFFGRLFGRG